MKEYNLETSLSFGKHKGMTIAEVMETSPSYITWCVRNIESFALQGEAIDALSKKKGACLTEEDLLQNEAKLQKSETGTDATFQDDEVQERPYRSHRYLSGNPAHDPDENPWIDFFGAGEEAETAYWNCD